MVFTKLEVYMMTYSKIKKGELVGSVTSALVDPCVDV